MRSPPVSVGRFELQRLRERLPIEQHPPVVQSHATFAE
jgi:hypothetical protein